MKEREEKKLTLEQLVDKYAKIQEQANELTEELKKLKSEIMDGMEKAGTSKVVTQKGVSATLVEKETFKYLNEAAMITWCENNGMENLIKKSVITTSMNKELKKGNVLTESLKPHYTRNISYALTVKE